MLLFQPLNFPPPWTVKKVKICSHLYHLSKKYDYIPSHHKQYTLEHICKKGPHHAIYTDGSKSLSGVGCAAVYSNQVSKYSLPAEASVFSAELTAILMAIDIIKTIPDKQSMKIIIYSDSRSAIASLRSFVNKNPLVLNIKYHINRLYKLGVNLEICWVPAHVGLAGNEKQVSLQKLQ